MKKSLLFILCLSLCMTALSKEVTRQQALQKARQFLIDKKISEPMFARGHQKELSSKAYHIFNLEDDGFIIVAGDDRMPDILGYSDKGNIDMHHIPCNMEWLMNSYANTIDSLNYYGVTKMWSPRRTNNFAPIDPLITTKWGQRAPFNKYCPEIDGERCPTGCVATAMAQIINYNKWPQGQTTSVDAYTTYSGINMPALEPTSFNWDAMTDDDIARLMLYCGQAAKLNYVLSGTGGAEPSEALKQVFGYSRSAKTWLILLFEAERLEQIVYEELSEKRPVFYTGYSASKGDGHAFVVDGYKDGLFHINWGWGGEADGYFLISGTTEDVMPFLPTWGSEMILGVEPKASTADQAKVFVTQLDNWIRNTYRRDASEDFLFPVSFDGEFFCDYDVTCDVGVGFYRDDKLVKVVASQQVTFPIINTDNFLYFNDVYIGKDIPQGTYDLYPVYRHDETGAWNKVAGSNPNHLVAHVGEKTLYFEYFVDEWNGHYKDYGYQEINGVTYGLTFQYNTNWAYVLPYQLTGKYSGDIVVPYTFEFEGKEFVVREERSSPFTGCENLRTLSVAIDQFVEVIDCPNLTQLDLKCGHYITIQNCPKLESIEFPVTTQAPSFSNCESLKTIRYTNIVPYFNNPSFSSHEFPSLTDIYFASATPPELQYIVGDIPPNPQVTMHVPKGCVPLYQNTPWRLWNIVDDNQAASMIKWSYCHNDRVSNYGMTSGNKGDDIDHELAMRIAPEDLVAYKGCKITQIEVFSSTRPLNDWGYEDYEYVFVTKRGTDYLVKQPFQVVRGAWNIVKLDNPYTITGEELFIGFGRRGQLGVDFSDDTFVPDAAWERFMGKESTPYAEIGKWDYSKECGNLEGPSVIFAHPLPLRFAIEGDHVPEGLVIRELVKDGTDYSNTARAQSSESRKTNESGIIINGVIRNRSLECVKSYTIEWSVDGGAKQSKTFETMLAPNATENISFELPRITTNGKHTVATNVTMVNENANQLDGVNMPILEFTVTDGTDINQDLEGDANGDGTVNVADIDYVIERIGEAKDDFNKSADVNGDDAINVADVDYIIERIK